MWQQAVKTSARALQSAHLQPIPTRCDRIHHGGIDWLIRIADRPHHDDRPHGPAYSDGHNPFLPFDPAMHVADVSPTHVCLLNKFNVVPNHLLIVTRDFEAQESPLSLADFEALWACMAEYDSLGFYNAGPRAGASQPHKHLQAVPLPLHDGCSDPVPLEPWYELADVPIGTVYRARRLPFTHSLSRLDPRWALEPRQAAAASHRLYRQMIAAIGWPEVSAATPYNLLLTRHWMLLVPRREECFHDISLNALAFAGAFFVKDDRQQQQLLQNGPLNALAYVSIGG